MIIREEETYLIEKTTNKFEIVILRNFKIKLLQINNIPPDLIILSYMLSYILLYYIIYIYIYIYIYHYYMYCYIIAIHVIT